MIKHIDYQEYIQYYGRILMVKPNHLRTHLENKIQVFCGKGKTEKDLEIWIKKTYKVTQNCKPYPDYHFAIILPF